MRLTSSSDGSIASARPRRLPSGIASNSASSESTPIVASMSRISDCVCGRKRMETRYLARGAGRLNPRENQQKSAGNHAPDELPQLCRGERLVVHPRGALLDEHARPLG